MDKNLKKVVDFLEEARIKHDVPKSELEKNGSVIYANGNDGTDFDWYTNHRLCEFGYGVKDERVWAFKLLLNRKGVGTVYCYPNGETDPLDTIERQIMTAAEAKRLKDLMDENADARFRFDCTLEELGLV